MDDFWAVPGGQKRCFPVSKGYGDKKNCFILDYGAVYSESQVQLKKKKKELKSRLRHSGGKPGSVQEKEDDTSGGGACSLEQDAGTLPLFEELGKPAAVLFYPSRSQLLLVPKGCSWQVKKTPG